MSEGTDKGVLTVEGAYDRRFATAVAVIVGLTAVVVTLIFLGIVDGIEVSGEGRVDDDVWVDGSFGQRAAAVGSLAALWLVALLWIAAAGLAALETRAVLTVQATPEEEDGLDRYIGPPDKALEQASKLVTAMSTSRGTVVLGVSGLLLGLLAVYNLGTLTDQDGGGTGDGAVSTADPSGDTSETTAPPQPGDDAAETSGPPAGTSGGDE